MFQNKNNWPLEHWHIEVSSRCPLQCPRCTRQEVPEGLVNTDLRVDWFKKNFTDIINHTQKITFCGDDGDPIYARDFLDICAWIKLKNWNCQIVIITNGSGKKKEFWSLLSKILTENDHIHFSIDGHHASNTEYRVNADWDSIMEGIATLNEENCKVFKTWAAIAFKFNINSLDFMRWMAMDKKFDYFQLTRSSKFGSNYEAYPKDDPLEPDNDYVSRGRFTRTIKNLSGRQWQDRCKDTFVDRFKTQKAIGNIQPLCGVGNKGLYINSQGKFYPCCWMGLRYEHNKNVFNYINQENKNLTEVLNDPNWIKLTESFENNTCPQECKEKCNKNKWDYDHATQW